MRKKRSTIGNQSRDKTRVTHRIMTSARGRKEVLFE